MRLVLRLLRYLFLSIVLTVVLLFAVFVVLDSRPGLHKYLAQAGIKYYALRGRYVSDDTIATLGVPFKEIDSYVGAEFVSHPILGKNFKPIEYKAKFGADGFRVGSTEPPYTLAVFGDSFMETGDRDYNTFSEFLVKHSGESSKNYGLSWHGPMQYLEIFKRYGLAEAPKYAIFGFFEGNDVRDIGAYKGFQKGKGYYGLWQPELSFGGRLLDALSSLRARFFGLFNEWVRYPIARMRGRFIDHDLNNSVEIDLKGNITREIFVYPSETRDPEKLLEEPDWQTLKEVFQEIVELSKDNEIEPYLLFLPTAQHIFAPYGTDRSGKDWLNRKDEQLAARKNTETAVRKLAEDVGLRFLTLTPLYEEHARKGERLYYRYDAHWNERARELAALFVLEELGLKKKLDLDESAAPQ